MKLVGRSLVSAITHTPASGPFSLFTVPEMYPSGARRCACSPSPAITPLTTTATIHRPARAIVPPSDIHDLEHALKILDDVAARGRPPLVRDIACKAQVRD